LDRYVLKTRGGRIMARFRITYQVERVGFGDTKEQAIQDSKSYEENPYENPLDQAEVIAIEEEE
jgi:hypothetical protein